MSDMCGHTHDVPAGGADGVDTQPCGRGIHPDGEASR